MSDSTDHEVDLDLAVAAVLEFCAAYSEFERSMGRNDLDCAVKKKEHAALLDAFCTPRERKDVDGLITYQRPPTYSEVSRETISNTAMHRPSVAHVDASCSLIERRFVMRSTRSGWKLDSVKWRAPGTKAWKNGLIGTP